MAQVTEAVRNQDPTAFKRLSYNEDVPSEILEEAQAAWEELLTGEYPEKGYEFDRVTYVNPPAEQPKRKRKGKVYEYNLEIIGYVAPNFQGGNKTSGRMIPIGRDPEGNIRFTLLKIKKD